MPKSKSKGQPRRPRRTVDIMKINQLRDLIEAAYAEGYEDGAAHGAAPTLHPPLVISWPQSSTHQQLYIGLDKSQKEAMRKWTAATYEQRENGDWLLSKRELAVVERERKLQQSKKG